VETAIGEKAHQHTDQDPSSKIKATSACYAHGPEERHALTLIPARLYHKKAGPADTFTIPHPRAAHASPADASHYGLCIRE
jgi:hypothetical protein